MTPAPRHVPALRTITVLARREAAAALGGFGVYIATTVALAAAVWLHLVDVRALDVAGILVPVDPYRAPLDVALLVLALFFAVSAAVSTARDRASGTLEVLFYGPVDETTYLLGKLLGLILAYVATLPLVAAGLFGVALLSGFSLPGTLPASLVLSLVRRRWSSASGSCLRSARAAFAAPCWCWGSWPSSCSARPRPTRSC
jgi:hypothetical protein